MSKAAVLLSTADYESVYGQPPAGVRAWSFAFDGFYVDGARLEAALIEANEKSQVVVAKLDGDCTLTISARIYDDAKKIAVEVAKRAVRESVTGLRMEVKP